MTINENIVEQAAISIFTDLGYQYASADRNCA